MENVKKNSGDRLQQIFTARTRSIYGGQVARFAEKRDDHGKVTRVGRKLPYSLEEFRVWMRANFPKVSNNWITRCGYCNGLLTLEACCSDHKTPIARGGALELTNLILCCDECNRIKGKLTALEYAAFRKGMETFSESARKDIYSRLKTGAGFVRMRFMGKKNAEVTA